MNTRKSSELKRPNSSRQTSATAKEVNFTSYAGTRKVAREERAHHQVIRVNEGRLRAAVDLPKQAKFVELAARILKTLTRVSMSAALTSKCARASVVYVQKTLFDNMKAIIELKPM